ncbi:uncharacterized protein DEA37_0001122 [Paragonimus westermani]|uniref:Uncharacterized protein n=1 Tax=Paragonimus westermani TaxID=34504 RepID=A0A5J4NXX9_9TREM|nr:uncharacterized protein DEA37_0001122 [Paragonimus westermani]
MAVGGPARHLPNNMVHLLAKASGANMPSAERDISWALGVCGKSDPDAVEANTLGPMKSSATLDGTKKDNAVQMSGRLAQTLITLGLFPASKLAKLRVSNKETTDQLNDMCRLLRMLSRSEDAGPITAMGELAEVMENEGEQTAVTAEGDVWEGQNRESTEFQLDMLALRLKSVRDSFPFQRKPEKFIAAFEFDDTGEFGEGMIHLYNRLQLRANLYEVPTRPEDAARQILEHMLSINSSDCSTRKLSQLFKTSFHLDTGNDQGEKLGEIPVRGILSKTGEILAPGVFQHALELESRLHNTVHDTNSNLKHTVHSHSALTETPKHYKFTLEEVQSLADRAQIWANLLELMESNMVKQMMEATQSEPVMKER